MGNLEAVKKKLRGSIAPIITPFNEDGSIDFETLEQLINWHIESGSHAISVTGTTGEPSSLTLEERVQVMKAAVKAVNGRVPFVPGTGSTNHAETLYLTKIAQEIGADAALVIVPYYNKPSQHALYKHFKAVADSVDIPIIVYNIPGRTAVNLEVKTLAKLREDCPNIIGVKESNKDFEHVNRVLLECGRDFLLYSGIELLCYPMLAIGGAGYISATANVEPKKVAEMYNAWNAGNVQRALELHYELMPLNDVLFKDTNPAPVKAALGMMGKIKPVLRLPMDLPTQALQDEIREVLKRYVDLPEEVSSNS
ncbi:4-hydroxy-tetrahydrodipicolinate synthase [Anoxybacillus sp. B7M1]|jgi:4-hydroxy-tetrahydrodipicolinate synthase|uniref:4-hydroxy-tetrahydrodipicolinate synthase n=1 Tax=Anoxybacteroides rupiense TaxID=311460 RepID=A0ABT5W9T2_9BACL|nr:MULTISPECIES: 2,4-dihydroxyhept-2-ene-1,7-dioic acid aldolase [Anoxybacillus]ANB59088.1 4-hydroxy-tetrahydrodipicolinate synthase [Anoxybacillus sp. B2M1]ANB63730.1 4-hydroxy-tetrahydrodipicolinate synthase [Anoxybacillus sp. B7M1]MBB3908717.1 4-hydroxy-tetrahydrodipicolinate synthase [Anoxybacillus rupiensis]MDE8564866.1 2,4-dihydroxyhept-2-ene-1,7-dioic acid aldolase [Anoxybacillus rupiensis]OQM47204.1 2,4-dihydroxyhept-2-ene-1,7-dioic acid aldolase [Anoxybacillus sp. UARK-01]